MYRLFYISLLLFLFSCEEEITLDINKDSDVLVVEGSIEPGFPPYIILTKNQGFFDPIDSETYSNLIVKDAEIKVWTEGSGDGFDTINLNYLSDELPVFTDISWNQNYEFSKIGKTYFLEIKWKDQIITSFTTIPNPTPLDCLWVEESETGTKEWQCDIRAVYSDPPGIQNNVLIRSKRLEHYEKDTISATQQLDTLPDSRFYLLDAGSDILIDGQKFETYFPRPSESGGFPNGKYNSSHFKGSTFIPNDVVLIKFCQIDEPSLKFWRSLVRQFTTNGNPFSEPMNLVSNINGGFGAWTGYAPAYYKVPVVKDTVIFTGYNPTIDEIY